jgi:hypothetical protein
VAASIHYEKVRSVSLGQIALRGLIAPVAVLALGVAGCGGGGSTTGASTASGAGPSASQPVADAEAKAGALNALTAMEVYATDHNGSYSGASAGTLREIEPRIPPDVKVAAERRIYTVTVPSATGGNTFSASRDASGTTSRTCKVPGEGGCPASGKWG